MGGFCLLIFPVKGMISMAVLFAELGLNIIWPYPEKSGPIIFYRNRERNDRKKKGLLNVNQAFWGGIGRNYRGATRDSVEKKRGYILIFKPLWLNPTESTDHGLNFGRSL